MDAMLGQAVPFDCVIFQASAAKWLRNYALLGHYAASRGCSFSNLSVLLAEGTSPCVTKLMSQWLDGNWLCEDGGKTCCLPRASYDADEECCPISVSPDTRKLARSPTFVIPKRISSESEYLTAAASFSAFSPKDLSISDLTSRSDSLLRTVLPITWREID
jgi:hypothetical protein